MSVKTSELRLKLRGDTQVENITKRVADVVAGKGDYRQVVQELGDFAAVYRQSLEVREVFSSPAVPMNGTSVRWI